MFGNYRVAADLPSRHKDKRPDILTMPTISVDGQLVGKTKIAARDHWGWDPQFDFARSATRMFELLRGDDTI